MAMNKKNIFTVSGIILSFVIAIGGWFLTSKLIDMESEKLLSVTAFFMVDSLPMIELSHSVDGDNFLNAGLEISESEMISILRNREYVDRVMLHEPTAEQINMEQAFESGKAGLDFLYAYGFLPEKDLIINNSRAYLSQNTSNNGQALPPQYSFWNVSFINENFNVYMNINAVTGQIWKIVVTVNQVVTDDYVTQYLMHVDTNGITDALDSFMGNIGIRSNDEVIIVRGIVDNPLRNIRENYELAITLQNETFATVTNADNVIEARKIFADGYATGVINAIGISAEDDSLYFNRLEIYLTTQET